MVHVVRTSEPLCHFPREPTLRKTSNFSNTNAKYQGLGRFEQYTLNPKILDIIGTQLRGPVGDRYFTLQISTPNVVRLLLHHDPELLCVTDVAIVSYARDGS